MIRFFSLFIFIITIFFITPLEGVNKNSFSPQWYLHQKEVYSLIQYQTHGAFIYLSDQKKIYTRFFLQKTNKDYYRLLLINLLGNTEIKFYVKSGVAQFMDHKGQQYIKREFNQSIKNLVKIPIPINTLIQWIIGLPGETNNYTIDDQYRLKEVHYTKSGKTWKVIYNSYDCTIQPSLPSKIEIIEGKRYFKLKMDDWMIK